MVSIIKATAPLTIERLWAEPLFTNRSTFATEFSLKRAENK
jgi:hypothetical protein